MNWFRQHPRASVVALGLLAVAIVAATVFIALPSDRGPALAAPEETTGRATPSASLDPKDTSTKKAAEDEKAAAGAGGDGSSVGGAPVLRGLNGQGISLNAPRHSITLSVTSSSPVGTLGYIIPTSRTDSYGRAKAGTSWSLSTVVYGPPDYAQVFIQAGPQGDPITCTITVDGRVTERRTIDGPYAQMLCQG